METPSEYVNIDNSGDDLSVESLRKENMLVKASTSMIDIKDLKKSEVNNWESEDEHTEVERQKKIDADLLKKN